MTGNLDHFLAALVAEFLKYPESEDSGNLRK